MDAIETYKHAGLTIEIHADEDVESPREWDNAGKLVIYGGGNLQDVNELDMTDDYAGWDELDKAVLKSYPRAELLPVYRYEHGNVAYNTTGFSCLWDSGRVGFILCEHDTIVKEWGKTIASKGAREMARKYMASEVETYSQYANGEVYGYEIKDEHGKDLPGDFSDSCWGMYGLDYCKGEAESAAIVVAEKWFTTAESRAAAEQQQRQEEAGQQRLAV